MRPSRDTYLRLLLARCVAMIGPVGIAILTARMLGPEDRGRYYYVIAVSNLAAQFASFGVHSSNSFLVSRNPALLPRLLTNAIWIAILGGFVIGGVVVLLELVFGAKTLDRTSLMFVPMMCPLSLLFIYLSNLAIAAGRPALFNGLIVFSAVVSLSAVMAAGYVAPTLEVFLSALVAAGVITCVMAWFQLAGGQPMPWRFEFGLFRESASYGVRAHIATAFGYFMACTGAVVLRSKADFADLGQWSIAAQIGDAMLILPSTISLVLFPALVRIDDERRWPVLNSTLRSVALTMAVLCIAAAALAHLLIPLLFGADYFSASTILMALLPGVYFLSLTSIVSQLLSSLGIPWTQPATWVAGWGLQVALSLLVFDTYGVLGLAWVQSGCAAFVFACLIGLAVRRRSIGRQATRSTALQAFGNKANGGISGP
jgi:O-antigen/teichoic acid export membrane protein